MWRARKLVAGLDPSSIWKTTRGAEAQKQDTRAASLGRAILLFIGFGILAAGVTILVVGMTFVFVPQDLEFIGISPAGLRAVSPVLVTLIAHDRAGFGGGLLARQPTLRPRLPSPSLTISGTDRLAVGYNDALSSVHLHGREGFPRTGNFASRA